MLLKYSERQIQTSVVMLLSQVYPNLLATAASIGKKNLTLFDAHLALAIAASPVTFYISISAFRDLLGYPNTLFSRISTAKHIIRLLGIFFPILWISLHATTSFSTKAFANSHLCEGMTVSQWIEFQAVSNFIGVLDVMGVRDLWSDLEGRGGLGATSLILAWIWAVYFVRHRGEIFENFQARKEEQLLYPIYIRWLRLIWQIPLSCWWVQIYDFFIQRPSSDLFSHIIFKFHPWMVFMIILCFHWSWILGIINGLKCDASSISYGQVGAISIFSLQRLIKALGTVAILYCASTYGRN